MIVLFVEGDEPIKWNIGNIRKGTHLLQKVFCLFTSFPEEHLHFRVLENEGPSPIEFLRQQGLGQFVSHLDQGNVTPSDPIIDLVQTLEAEESNEGDENSEEPAG